MPPQKVHPPYSNNQYGASYDSLAPNNPFSDRSASLNAPSNPYYAGPNSYSNYSNPNFDSAYGAGAMSKESLAPVNTTTGGGGQRARTGSAPSPASLKQQHSAWMEGGKEPANASPWKKWALIGGLVVLVLAGVAGGIAGWRISQSNSSSSSSGTSSAADNLPNPETDREVGSDPSSWQKDSRLHQSFWGIAYTPQNVQLPDCGAVQSNVSQEIQIISQLTTRIRTYGSDCNQSAMIMQAIQDTQVDLSVWLGIYVDDNATTWDRGVQATLDVVQTYGTANIAGITVGNEYILDQNATSASYTYIEDKVAEFKKELDALNLDKTIPVGTADAGSVMTAALNRKVDYAMSNVHPW